MNIITMVIARMTEIFFVSCIVNLNSNQYNNRVYAHINNYHDDHDDHQRNNHYHDYDDHDHIDDTSTLRRRQQQQQQLNNHSDSNDDISASIQRCGSRRPTASEHESASNTVAKYLTKKLLLVQSDQTTAQQPVLIEVDTYFHVITDGLVGSVSKRQLQYQLIVLNESYQPFGFTFRLLNTTTTNNSDWYRAGIGSVSQTNMKESLRSGTASTLNVYFNAPGAPGILSLGGQVTLGYATFPWDYNSRPKEDGVVVLSASIPLGTAQRFNEGKTLVHEVGHWLGLFHTFQTDLGFFQVINFLLYVLQLRNGCNSGGDNVNDTPPQRSATKGCPVGRDSCRFHAGDDPIHNYMDYSDDACYESFTPGQADRMMAMWEEYRAA